MILASNLALHSKLARLHPTLKMWKRPKCNIAVFTDYYSQSYMKKRRVFLPFCTFLLHSLPTQCYLLHFHFCPRKLYSMQHYYSICSNIKLLFYECVFILFWTPIVLLAWSSLCWILLWYQQSTMLKSKTDRACLFFPSTGDCKWWVARPCT